MLPTHFALKKAGAFGFSSRLITAAANKSRNGRHGNKLKYHSFFHFLAETAQQLSPLFFCNNTRIILWILKVVPNVPIVCVIIDLCKRAITPFLLFLAYLLETTLRPVTGERNLHQKCLNKSRKESEMRQWRAAENLNIRRRMKCKA